MKTSITNRNTGPTLQDEHDAETDRTSEKQFGSLRGGRMIRAIAIASAVSVVVLLSGCASAPALGGAGAVDNYNSDTDYSQLRYANHL